MPTKAPKPKRGPKPEVLKLTGNWEDNVKRSLQIKPAPKKPARAKQP